MKAVHKTDCARVFRRYDLTCPRCQELANGSKPRAGWGDHAKHVEAMQIAALRAHNCTQANCGPVCTFGQW